MRAVKKIINKILTLDSQNPGNYVQVSVIKYQLSYEVRFTAEAGSSLYVCCSLHKGHKGHA